MESPSTTSSQDFDVITTDTFLKAATELRKKYPNIKNDFFELMKKLKKDPTTGNYSIGSGIYKVRMRIADKNKGERDGARVIIEVRIVDNTVYVVYVYDKSEMSNVNDQQLNRMVKYAVASRPVQKTVKQR